MTLSLSEVIFDGRREAEAIMLDVGQVTRRTGFTVQDENTGAETPEYEVIFETKCKLQSRSRLGDSFISETFWGVHQGVSLDLDLHMPVNAPPVKTDDVIIIISTGYATDSQMLGRKLRVLASPSKSHATSRRVPIKEVVA